MSADPRAALSQLVAAFERHLEASSTRHGDDDPAVVAAYEDLADAFEAYDGALLRRLRRDDAPRHLQRRRRRATTRTTTTTDDGNEDDELDDHDDEDGDGVYLGLDDEEYDAEDGDDSDASDDDNGRVDPASRAPARGRGPRRAQVCSSRHLVERVHDLLGQLDVLGVEQRRAAGWGCGAEDRCDDAGPVAHPGQRDHGGATPQAARPRCAPPRPPARCGRRRAARRTAANSSDASRESAGTVVRYARPAPPARAGTRAAGRSPARRGAGRARRSGGAGDAGSTRPSWRPAAPGRREQRHRARAACQPTWFETPT